VCYVRCVSQAPLSRAFRSGRRLRAAKPTSDPRIAPPSALLAQHLQRVLRSADAKPTAAFKTGAGKATANPSVLVLETALQSAGVAAHFAVMMKRQLGRRLAHSPDFVPERWPHAARVFLEQGKGKGKGKGSNAGVAVAGTTPAATGEATPAAAAATAAVASVAAVDEAVLDAMLSSSDSEGGNADDQAEQQGGVDRSAPGVDEELLDAMLSSSESEGEGQQEGVTSGSRGTPTQTAGAATMDGEPVRAMRHTEALVDTLLDSASSDGDVDQAEGVVISSGVAVVGVLDAIPMSSSDEEVEAGAAVVEASKAESRPVAAAVPQLDGLLDDLLDDEDM